jgi:hypothetical protein
MPVRPGIKSSARDAVAFPRFMRPTRLGAAHTLSPDASCAHPGLRSLGDGYAPPSMAALAVYAVSRGWAAPSLPQTLRARRGDAGALERAMGASAATMAKRSGHAESRGLEGNPVRHGTCWHERAFSILPLPLGEAGRRPGEGAAEVAQIPCTLTPTLSQRERGVAATFVPNRIAWRAEANVQREGMGIPEAGLCAPTKRHVQTASGNHRHPITSSPRRRCRAVRGPCAARGR